ncbi:elongator complex protein 4 isoform X1 [Ambystoma mexicanum]|uniref:elongator complex protein 4 isoform X1 n=1 Tax=Ambystoma mexicanum TaxID=8296 RepID=UPI0037E96141
MAASMSGVAGEVSATSFQRKPRCGGSKLLSIPGTRPSLRNGQLLVSSGVPSLDHIIGGGLAVGTLLLIEEDKYNIYSQLLLKYFLAEGVISGHSLFVGSAENNPKDILQELPAPSLDDLHKGKSDPEEISASKPSQESMKIAWRYQNLPKVSVNTVTSSRFGHYYDVTKTMSPEMLQSSQCHCFFLPEETLDSTPSICGMTYAYTRLLKSIHSVIHKEGFDGSCPQKKTKNVLRIGIQSLGSPLWGDDICCSDQPHHMHSLTKFLYALRCLLRMSLSICVITVPAHLIQNKAIMGRATHLSDTAVGLESFIGSERETNPLYKEYHGLFRVNQLPRLNTMAPDTSGVKDLAFKLKRKLFTIEGPNVTQPLTGYLPTKETTEDGICWMQATTFASRLVRHSEPFKQTGSGRICKTAELRMWHNGCRREAPGLLVIYA